MIIQRVEKIIEQIKFVDKEVFIEGKGGDESDCDCLTEVNFVELWNKKMQIKFADNNLKDDCLSGDRFTQLLSK